ncbi:hypothetical protein [Aliikangiella sp. IMCC44359]|uniref:hypothetical protein n=1 Tax=Aliikangiella sp. IMCC44359 TaxID=3459125 RepID=UPI00403A9786
MTTNQSSISTAAEFRLITSKRVALEQLIKIAQGVHNQQIALSELAIAARPSQSFPPQLMVYFGAIEKRMQSIAASEIIQRLETIEKVTEETLANILYLSQLNIDELRNNHLEKAEIENFTESITDFKRRTKTALALRYILQKRGVIIEAFKLPISQEAINEQVEKLKEKEHECVKQIKTEINHIIRDTEQLLTNNAISAAMKSDLKGINRAMQLNIEHLENGGSVTEIPHVFEIIVLESEDNSTNEAPLAKNEATNNNSTQTETPKQKELFSEQEKNVSLSFWKRLIIWLTSPPEVSWKIIKEKYKAE